MNECGVPSDAYLTTSGCLGFFSRPSCSDYLPILLDKHAILHTASSDNQADLNSRAT